LNILLRSFKQVFINSYGMHAVLALLRLVRLPNLVMVALTQFLPYWFVLRPAILKAGGIPAITETIFTWMTLATVLTTLAGYVLNDYYDRNMDAINKPHRLVWGRYMPATIALLVYTALVIFVHVLALMIDDALRPINHWPLWVYPGVSFLLFLYAWQLKCTAIIGNFLVSFLCGLVPILVVFSEERALWITSFYAGDIIQQAVGLVWLYGLFAFITNLFREQVKDLEDFIGDAACGCNTLAVMRGPRFAKKPAFFTGLTVSILIAFLLYFWEETAAPRWQTISGFVLMLLPSLVASVLVFRAKAKEDYSRASLFIKMVMFFGLFLLLRSWPDDIVQAIATWLE
jgi:4-hydroxybenzoate polyprenyltransferase